MPTVRTTRSSRADFTAPDHISDVSDSLGNTYAIIAGPFDRPGFRHYVAPPRTPRRTHSLDYRDAEHEHADLSARYAGLPARMRRSDRDGRGRDDRDRERRCDDDVCARADLCYIETGTAVRPGSRPSTLDGNLTEDRTVDTAATTRHRDDGQRFSWTMMATFR